MCVCPSPCCKRSIEQVSDMTRVMRGSSLGHEQAIKSADQLIPVCQDYPSFRTESFMSWKTTRVLGKLNGVTLCHCR